MSFNLLVFDDEEEEFLLRSCAFLIQSSIHFGSCCFLSVFVVQFFAYNWGWQERNQHCCHLYIIISSICLVLGYQGVLPWVRNWIIVVTEGFFSNVAVTVNAVNQSSFFVCFWTRFCWCKYISQDDLDNLLSLLRLHSSCHCSWRSQF